jgi:RND family efflux transporter MFP subunit
LSHEPTTVSEQPKAAVLSIPAPTPARAVPIALVVAAASIIAAGALLERRAESKTNHVALAQSPKRVSVVAALSERYVATRLYVGTLEPWLAASVGPQLVSSFVDTVLVRPGAVVRRGEVLATLDCRDASAASQTVAGEARAIDARQKAVASEAARLRTMLAGNFVSANEAEQKAAQSAAAVADLDATRARLARKSLEVNDCILRAPFDGEVATRSIDPGAFVRPGVSVVSVVDRGTVRLVADVPEIDFEVVAPGREAQVAFTAVKRQLRGTIARRSPAADATTRTVRFEIDLPDAERKLPVGTTGEVRLPVGDPVPATRVPLRAATVRGKVAVVFVVEGEIARARTVAVLGESAGDLYLATTLAPGSLVVSEGRAMLADGDRVVAQEEARP